MSKGVADIALIDILPPSISGDDGIKAAAAAVDDQLQDINANVDLVQILTRIDELPSEVLDFLAWQFHVDVWLSSYSLSTKREKIKSALKSHIYKGTVWAVEESLRLEGYADAEVIASVGDWWEFDIEATALTGVSPLDIVYSAIENAKNLRSKLRQLKINFNAQAVLNAGAAVCIYVEL